MVFVLTCLFIFSSRIIDVSMMAVRTILLTKGKSGLAALIGFFEVLIYMSVLSIVVDAINENPIYLVFYAAGFACGLLVGTKIEEKLAFGLVTMRIIIQDKDREFIQVLRETGFGVTVVKGEGRDGARDVLYVTVKRKSIQEVRQLIEQYEIQAFISIMDVRNISGGIMKTSQMFFKKK